MKPLLLVALGAALACAGWLWWLRGADVMWFEEWP